MSRRQGLIQSMKGAGNCWWDVDVGVGDGLWGHVGRGMQSGSETNRFLILCSKFSLVSIMI